jgi:hypothetical protein
MDHLKFFNVDESNNAGAKYMGGFYSLLMFYKQLVKDPVKMNRVLLKPLKNF